MAFQVFDAVLQVAVDRLMQILDNPCSCLPHSCKVGLYILHKYSQALGIKAEFRWAAIDRFSGVEHHPGIAEAQLSTR